MPSTETLQTWLPPGIEVFQPDGPAAPARPIDGNRTGRESGESAPPTPAREHDAHLEIVRLRGEIEDLVRNQSENPRDAVDSALESVTRLLVVTANVEACRPPAATFAGAAMVALADEQLRGHSDAIERGMTYTADNQLRLLHEKK